MIERAEEYIWANARVLEQRRFELLFKGGDPRARHRRASSPTRRPTAATGTRSSPTGAARRASRRTSGPRWRRSRTPGPPTPTSATTSPTITAPDGGVPVALPSLEPFPHAPWWRIGTEGKPARAPRSCTRRSPATASTTPGWNRPRRSAGAAIDAIERTHPYEVEAAITFLDAARDRDRAEQAAERLGTLVREQNLVGTQPEGYTEGEIHHPHDFARRPDSLARPWFSDEEIDSSLDHLAAKQHEDGGWRITWAVWLPAIEIRVERDRDDRRAEDAAGLRPRSSPRRAPGSRRRRRSSRAPCRCRRGPRACRSASSASSRRPRPAARASSGAA